MALQPRVLAWRGGGAADALRTLCTRPAVCGGMRARPPPACTPHSAAGAWPLLAVAVGGSRPQPPRRCAAAAQANGAVPVPPAPLATSDAPEDLQRDADWIARMVALWLDEEWTPQGVHADLGRAAGASYARLRAGGEDEMGGLLMGLVGDLAAFNYRECFVGPFDVANKVVEMMMQRDGTDVCCTSEADRSRAARLEGGSGGGRDGSA